MRRHGLIGLLVVLASTFFACDEEIPAAQGSERYSNPAELSSALQEGGFDCPGAYGENRKGDLLIASCHPQEGPGVVVFLNRRAYERDLEDSAGGVDGGYVFGLNWSVGPSLSRDEAARIIEAVGGEPAGFLGEGDLPPD
jgi:hypothetical protein